MGSTYTYKYIYIYIYIYTYTISEPGEEGAHAGAIYMITYNEQQLHLLNEQTESANQVNMLQSKHFQSLKKKVFIQVVGSTKHREYDSIQNT